MEDDLEELADVGRDVSAASLRLEARFVTVTLLASALAESLAHTIIGMAANKTLLGLKRRIPLFELWKQRIPLVIGCAPFLTGKLEGDLSRLSKVRNAITHANPRLYSGDKAIAEGNAERWEQMDVKTVRMFVGLPLRLLAAVPRTERYAMPLAAFADDYWLHQAVARSEDRPGRSHNMWRPGSREGRLREMREKKPG